ncbi:unnamed protein product [Prorocentrum cordatum]|uniref:Uncharacterized protein n=1 Tax=Prorocentrum cordatum TaxID=2364126 RepID=A0ABN9WD19_9DINO|nr:unnamed protein product [Polarella glacialis]
MAGHAVADAAISVAAVLPDADGHSSRALDYLLSHTPGWLVALWLVGGCCTACTVLVSYRQTLEHVRAGRESGYGGNPFASFSFGPRASRMLHLLLMPPMLSVSAVFQMVLPSAEPLCSLLRTVQVSLAVLRLAELLFILAGGWTRLQARLPKEPVKAFGQPPLCCFVCSKVVTEDDIRMMTAGIRQFSWSAPLLGTIDAYFQAVQPDHQGMIRSVLVALVAVTTVTGMWSFNNLYALLTRALGSGEGTQKDRQAFVTIRRIKHCMKRCLRRFARMSRWSALDPPAVAPRAPPPVAPGEGGLSRAMLRNPRGPPEDYTSVVERRFLGSPRSQSTSSAFLLQESTCLCCGSVFSGRASAKSTFSAFLLCGFSCLFRPTCTNFCAVVCFSGHANGVRQAGVPDTSRRPPQRRVHQRPLLDDARWVPSRSRSSRDSSCASCSCCWASSGGARSRPRAGCIPCPTSAPATRRICSPPCS